MAIQAGYYQFDPQFGKREDNLARVIAALERADADIVVLPELAFTGYSFRDRNELETLAEEPEKSAAVNSLADLCGQRDFHLVTGFAEKCNNKIFNSALLIGPDGIVDTYRKIHLYQKEKDCFDAGDAPPRVTEVRGIRIGMMVCFDWIFPETARTLALQGADLICHPANLVLTYCQDAMVTRCIENGLFAVTANRYGTEKRPHAEITFTGQSQVTAPRGEIIHRSDSTREELFITAIDSALARDKMITERNHVLRDRRPECYKETI